MSKIKVKSEKLAERCEICHQKDCFDASKNYCYRCEKTDKVEVNKTRKTVSRVKNLVLTLQRIEFHIRQDERFSLSNGFDKFSWKILMLYLMEIHVYPLFRASLIAEILVYLLFLIAITLIAYVVLSNALLIIILFAVVCCVLFSLGILIVIQGISDVIGDSRRTNYKHIYLDENISDDKE